jgi:tetratricopeptide (TPR) repeat protein
LKEGKRFLKEKNGPAAMVRFEKALMLSRASGQKLAQRRAYRGLAAAERLQGQSKAAIKHLLVVLELSRELGNNQGDADAYGSIADLYTDLGDYDQAAKYYDLYITEMRKAAGAPATKQGSA